MLVVWTPEAITRHDDIEDYIAQDSPANAKEMVARLLVRTRQLKTAALSGREVPEENRGQSKVFANIRQPWPR